MKLEITDNVRKYAVNTGYLFFEKGLRIIVTLFIWALVVRYLGPEQFGLFSYALSFVFLFHIFSDLGLDTIAIRDLVRAEKQQKVILGSLFLMKLVGAISAVVLIAITTRVLPVALNTRALILVISIRLIFRAFYNIDFYFQSRVLSKYTVYARVLSLITTTILCLIFIYLKKPVIYFAYVVVIEYFVESMGLVVLYRRKKSISSWKADWLTIKKLFRDALPLIVTGIAISIYMRIDQIMIKQMLGVEWVGYYSAAIRVSEAAYFIPVAICGSLFPAIITSKHRSEELYYNRLQALFTLLSWIALSTSLCLSVFSVPLIHMLYGAEYSLSAGVLAIHTWAAIFVFLGLARGKWAVNENLQFFVMIYACLGAAINIILNFIFLPIFSIWGAAFATIIAQSISAVFGNLLSKKTRSIFFLQVRSLNIVESWKLCISKLFI